MNHPSILRVLASTASLTLLLLASELSAQTVLTERTLRREADTPPAATTLEELSLLSGHWQGEAFGGLAEHLWMPELGNAMTGVFKLVVDGRVDFQQLMNLRPDSATGLELVVKHFDAAMSSWEEKEEMLTFPFIRMEGSTVWFSGLTFERAGADRMNIYLAMRQEDGTTSEAAMTLYRVGSSEHSTWQKGRAADGAAGEHRD